MSTSRRRLMNAGMATASAAALLLSTASSATAARAPAPPSAAPAVAADVAKTPTGTLGFVHKYTHPNAAYTGYDLSSKNYYTGGSLCLPAGTEDEGYGIPIDADGDGMCPYGGTLTDMNVGADGTLVAAYGEWNTNVDSFGLEAGRVAVIPLQLSTGTWGPALNLGSEAFDVVRRLPDGSLAVPTTDPGDKAATGMPHGNISGHATNEGGSWHFVRDDQSMEHLFDVLKAPDGSTWEFGARSVEGSTGAVLRAAPGTSTFTLMRSDTTTTPNGFERDHWGAVAGNRIITKFSDNINAMHYDLGTKTWTQMQNAQLGNDYFPNRVESYAGKVVAGGGGSSSALKVTDGSTTRALSTPDGSSTRDFFQASDGLLYALNANGAVYRTNAALTGWQKVTDVKLPEQGRTVDRGVRGQDPHRLRERADLPLGRHRAGDVHRRPGRLPGPQDHQHPLHPGRVPDHQDLRRVRQPGHRAGGHQDPQGQALIHPGGAGAGRPCSGPAHWGP